MVDRINVLHETLINLDEIYNERERENHTTDVVGINLQAIVKKYNKKKLGRLFSTVMMMYVCIRYAYRNDVCTV